MEKDLSVVCGMLGYFVGSGWCGVEVRVNGCGGECSVFEMPTPGLLFRGGRCGSYFLPCGCFVGVVGVYSRFTIGSGEYRLLIHPCRFPVYIECYKEDRCVFILWVSFVELVRDEPAIYVSAELFR